MRYVRAYDVYSVSDDVRTDVGTTFAVSRYDRDRGAGDFRFVTLLTYVLCSVVQLLQLPERPPLYDVMTDTFTMIPSSIPTVLLFSLCLSFVVTFS